MVSDYLTNYCIQIAISDDIFGFLPPFSAHVVSFVIFFLLSIYSQFRWAVGLYGNFQQNIFCLLTKKQIFQNQDFFMGINLNKSFSCLW